MMARMPDHIVIVCELCGEKITVPVRYEPIDSSSFKMVADRTPARDHALTHARV